MDLCRITFANRPEINGPIILNLGRGIKTQTHSAYTRELSLSANATIVQPEYHVSESNPYPAPIHMVCRTPKIESNMLQC